MKGVLIAHGVEPPQIHDLGRLHDLLLKAGVPWQGEPWRS